MAKNKSNNRSNRKTDRVNTCLVSDCVIVQRGDEHWSDFHMPCWICGKDIHDMRNELLWFEEELTYFHRSCLLNRMGR